MLNKLATILVIAFCLVGTAAIISFAVELLDDRGRWE